MTNHNFYLESATDDRAVVCDENNECRVIHEIPQRHNRLRAVNTLKNHIVKEMQAAARDAGFALDTETMYV